MGSLWVEEPVHTSWSTFCTVNNRASASNYQLLASNYQHEAPRPRFKPVTSGIEGEHSNRYTTEPPLTPTGTRERMTFFPHWQVSSNLCSFDEEVTIIWTWWHKNNICQDYPKVYSGCRRRNWDFNWHVNRVQNERDTHVGEWGGKWALSITL